VNDRHRCTYPDCDGVVDAGYCETCGRAAATAPAPVGAAAGAPTGLGALGTPWDPAAAAIPSAPSAPPLPVPDIPAAADQPWDAGPPVAAPRYDSGNGAIDPGTGPAGSTGPSGRAPTTVPTYKLPGAPADGSPCTFPGCDGVVDGGYCGVCGRAPAGAGAVAASPRPRMPQLRPAALRTDSASFGRRRTDSGRTDSGRTTSRRTGGTRLGLGLVEVPAVRTGDPAEALMPVAEVPEEQRFCSNCNQAVGRSRNQRPGRTEGFCPNCRSHFSFTPKLVAGELVAGQYEVLGALSHGGLGWIYLARDRAVSDRWVVLKGLLDATSEDAAMAAVAERRFLAALDHPNVVQIYNFVTHEGAGYIVMEYVGGKSLKQVLKERRDANGGTIDPLPVDQAIAYVLAVLPAMGYLHTQGLVFCDMKPDNVVLTGDSLKLIDLGGVRHIDDDEGAIYGTTGYQSPEVAEDGPSVASDLYTVGRMLAVLVLDFRGYQSTYLDKLPPPDVQPLLAERESLHRFLLKATATDPLDRFESAEEMSEQLLGILREEAGRRGQAQPAVSTVFGPDGVVGAGADAIVEPDWHLLPPPKVDPNDPGVGFVLGLADGEPAAVVASLTQALATKAVPATPETVLRLARAHLDADEPDQAGSALDRLGDIHDWRAWWHRGLQALARQRPTEAIDWLDPVYTELAGEVPAKLALALAHELAGDATRSADLYDIASRTDPSYVSGAFGLARVRLAVGDREAAVDALERVPAASSMHTAARIATVRALASVAAPGQAPPTGEQIERASVALDQLHLEPRRHALLARELFEAGLAALAAGAPPSRSRVLGRPLAEAPLREGLEATYRELAHHAESTRARVELIDKANKVRARTLL
jgi:serine/threonine-protein kinase PknG